MKASYVTNRHDNAKSIAGKFGLKEDQLRLLNADVDFDNLQAGTVIQLPVGDVEVKKEYSPEELAKKKAEIDEKYAPERRGTKALLANKEKQYRLARQSLAETLRNRNRRMEGSLNGRKMTTSSAANALRSETRTGNARNAEELHLRYSNEVIPLRSKLEKISRQIRAEKDKL